MYVFKHNDNVLNYVIAIQDIMSRFNALGGSLFTYKWYLKTITQWK